MGVLTPTLALLATAALALAGSAPPPIGPSPIEPSPVEPSPIEPSPVEDAPGEPSPGEPPVEPVAIEPPSGAPPRAAQDPAPAERAWGATWAELARVAALEPGSPARAAGVDELASRARAVLAEPGTAYADRWRAEMLRAHVARLSGGEPGGLVLDPAAPAPAYGPGEAWLATQVLSPGRERARAAARALREASAQEYPARLDFAWKQVFEPETRALRLAGLLPLAEAMHERSQAGWSAQTLAQVCTRLGDYARADRVVAEELERTEDPAARAALLQQRALNALGSGSEERGRSFAGAALALGSSDAQIVLGRLELAAGHRERARRLFGAAVAGPKPGAWALRGWGLTMLPARAPATPLARPGGR